MRNQVLRSELFKQIQTAWQRVRQIATNHGFKFLKVPTGGLILDFNHMSDRDRTLWSFNLSPSWHDITRQIS